MALITSQKGGQPTWDNLLRREQERLEFITEQEADMMEADEVEDVIPG